MLAHDSGFVFVYAVSEHLTKISFGLKIILAMLQVISMDQNLKIKFVRIFTKALKLPKMVF